MRYFYNQVPDLPAKGRLQIDAFAIDIGRPMDNAIVRVMPRGGRYHIIEEMVTNSSGQTYVIDLPAPPVDFSMQYSEQKPYSEYDVSVTMDGYEQVYVEGVQILPDTVSYQDVALNPLTGYPREGAETIIIGEHTLWGDYPPMIPQPEVKPLPEHTGFVVLPEPVIPEFVVVHMGMPSNTSAQRHWVPFKDYIKSVASSEIYATWPEQTLHANILAIISLTLNRVFTEWYRGQGFDFTITNTTQLDQKYIHGRNVFVEISQVVDEIFTTYITRPDIRQPLFAQYNDGRRTNFPGRLSQWGSKDLGDKGYAAFDILKHFYGHDIYLTQAKKVSGVPNSYPGTALRVGSSGQDVRVIQEQLNAISENFPAIPKLRVDGIFDENTERAVKTFQEINHLTQDGIVGFATWYRISHIFVAVTRMAEL